MPNYIEAGFYSSYEAGSPCGTRTLLVDAHILNIDYSLCHEVKQFHILILAPKTAVVQSLLPLPVNVTVVLVKPLFETYNHVVRHKFISMG